MVTGPKPKLYGGRTLKEWAAHAGITERLLRSRLEGGWTLERAVSSGPPRKAKLYEGKTLSEWSKASGIHVSVLRGRLKQGWTLAKSLSEPVHQAKRIEGKTAVRAGLYSYKGNEYALGQLLDLHECIVDGGLLAARLHLGWSVERAITEPRRPELELTAWGETKTLVEWFRDSRCVLETYDTLVSRYKRGWDAERALTQTPQGGAIQAWGESKTLREWVEDPRCKATYSTVSQRLAGGVPPEQALTSHPDSSKARKRSEEPASIDGIPIVELMKDPKAVVKDYATIWSRGDRGMGADQAIMTPIPAPSSGESDLTDFIEDLGLDVIRNCRSTIGPKELDILVPDLNLAFEYNGVYWHTEDKVGRTYHHDKWRACKDQGITLIQIWEDDWILRRPQAERLVESKLGKLRLPKVSGRKSRIEVLEYGTANTFLGNHHIQGGVSGSAYLGLSYESDLVAVMVLKRVRDEWRLERYATSAIVRGGFSKILSHFVKEYAPQRIVTFADHCVSDGGLYESLGWEYDAELAPDYRYIVPGDLDRKHKFRFRKRRFQQDEKLKFDPALSETELAELNGLKRVYDAGKTRYVYLA